mgnify:CR=1 FL=1
MSDERAGGGHGPTREFWQSRFEAGTTPWHRGNASPQVARWLADGVLSGSVVVPGCGHGHEVAVLAAAGLRVTALDYAAGACALTRDALRAAGLSAEVIEADVLAWQPAAPLDCVYEQTCLCALHPDQWRAYADQLHRWLKPGGRLAALVMQCRRDGAADGLVEGPPYHLDINAVRALFPAALWSWPAPPYARIAHPSAIGVELALVLVRR